MTRKKYWKSQSNKEKQNYKKISVASKVLFIVGICTMFISLIYMVFNLSIADTVIIRKWLIAMVTGIGTITAGLIVDAISSMTRGKNK